MNAMTANEPLVNLHGEHVALGPVYRDHIPLLHRWNNDLGVLRTLAMPPIPRSEEQAVEFYMMAGGADVRPLPRAALGLA